jgi:hypothetical protein
VSTGLQSGSPGPGCERRHPRLIEWLRQNVDLPLDDLPSTLIDDVLAFSGGILKDDVAIMAVRIEA